MKQFATTNLTHFYVQWFYGFPVLFSNLSMLFGFVNFPMLMVQFKHVA